MKPVKFKEANIVFAKDQPQYHPLPAHSDGHHVTSCWRLSLWERIRLLVTGRLYLQVLTFKQPLQPQKLSTKVRDLIPWKDRFRLAPRGVAVKAMLVLLAFLVGGVAIAADRLTLSAGVVADEYGDLIDDNSGAGRIAWTHSTTDRLSIRGLVQVANTRYDQTSVRFNGLVHLRGPDVTFRPFVTAGLGLEFFDAPVENSLSANVGVGLDLDMKRVGLTFEIDYNATDLKRSVATGGGLGDCYGNNHGCGEGGSTTLVADAEAFELFAGVYFDF